MGKEKIPFKIGTHFTQGLHHRYDLRSWIRNEFPFVGSYVEYTPEHLNAMEERSLEILEACKQIEEIDIRAGSAYVEYYAPCWRKIRIAVEGRDFQKLGGALDFLLRSIDTE